jgi:hypothetical protein
MGEGKRSKEDSTALVWMLFYFLALASRERIEVRVTEFGKIVAPMK